MGLILLLVFLAIKFFIDLTFSVQSAVMAGLRVVPVKTHHDGNLDLEDLKAKAEKHKDNLAAFMVGDFSGEQVFMC